MSFRRASATLVGLVALGVGFAGCGGSSTTPQARTTPSLVAAWHQVVLCARQHGMPGLQDPRIDSSGKPIFPHGLEIPEQTRRACQRLVDQLIPGGVEHAPTPAQIASLLQFARCMRSHGIPDWPDPRPDGTFAPDQRIGRMLKSRLRSQLVACERFNPDTNGHVYFSRS